MKTGLERLTKKKNCTDCGAKLIDGQLVTVARDDKGKVKKYLCTKHEEAL